MRNSLDKPNKQPMTGKATKEGAGDRLKCPFVSKANREIYTKPIKFSGTHAREKFAILLYILIL